MRPRPTSTVDGYLYAVVSLKELPDATFPGMLKNFSTLGFPVVISGQVVIPDQVKVLKSYKKRLQKMTAAQKDACIPMPASSDNSRMARNSSEPMRRRSCAGRLQRLGTELLPHGGRRNRKPERSFISAYSMKLWLHLWQKPRPSCTLN